MTGITALAVIDAELHNKLEAEDYDDAQHLLPRFREAAEQALGEGGADPAEIAARVAEALAWAIRMARAGREHDRRRLLALGPALRYRTPANEANTLALDA